MHFSGYLFIASSNLSPDDLYKDSLQHEQFIPAIKLIKQHMGIFHFLISHHDYRLSHLSQKLAFTSHH